MMPVGCAQEASQILGRHNVGICSPPLIDMDAIYGSGVCKLAFPIWMVIRPLGVAVDSTSPSRLSHTFIPFLWIHDAKPVPAWPSPACP